MSKKKAADKAREIAKQIDAGEFHGFAYVAFGRDGREWGWTVISDTEAHAAPSYLTRELCRWDKDDTDAEQPT